MEFKHPLDDKIKYSYNVYPYENEDTLGFIET